MQSPTFVPLSTYTELEPAEMVARARAFRDQLRRRRTVRMFSDRPVARDFTREGGESCLCFKRSFTPPFDEPSKAAS